MFAATEAVHGQSCLKVQMGPDGERDTWTGKKEVPERMHGTRHV